MIASLLAVPDILDSMCGYTVTAWGSCIHLSTVHTQTSADQRALSRLPLAVILPFLNKKMTATALLYTYKMNIQNQ